MPLRNEHCGNVHANGKLMLQHAPLEIKCARTKRTNSTTTMKCLRVIRALFCIYIRMCHRYKCMCLFVSYAHFCIVASKYETKSQFCCWTSTKHTRSSCCVSASQWNRMEFEGSPFLFEDSTHFTLTSHSLSFRLNTFKFMRIEMWWINLRWHADAYFLPNALSRFSMRSERVRLWSILIWNFNILKWHRINLDFLCIIEVNCV